MKWLVISLSKSNLLNPKNCPTRTDFGVQKIYIGIRLLFALESNCTLPTPLQASYTHPDHNIIWRGRLLLDFWVTLMDFFKQKHLGVNDQYIGIRLVFALESNCTLPTPLWASYTHPDHNMIWRGRLLLDFWVPFRDRNIT